MAKILIVDDDPCMLVVLTELLRTWQHTVLAAPAPARALELVKTKAPDLVITDIEMPDGKPAGLKLLSEIKDHDRTIPVIVVTGQGTKERAVTALRAGAQDFIEKPFHLDELGKRIENALLQRLGMRALEENVALKKQLTDKFQIDNIVGNSQPMQNVYRLIRRVADTDVTVLILGESGTGKELVAKALHHTSRRAARPFIAVNCAAMPEHLLESELFGHRKGAFTGATFDKPGLFQAAEGGTIFLDEIGSMPANLQGKLLRFLQEKEVRHVGDTETVKVDVRVLAATNEPLEAKLRDKSFREDLYYRLNVIAIQVPALRQRPDDIPLLAAHFIQEIAKRAGGPPVRLSPAAAQTLAAYHWPGNVRELQNAIERAAVLCDDGVIAPHDLPEPTPSSDNSPRDAAAAVREDGGLIPLKDYLHLQAVAYIKRALSVTDSREKAARMLGVSPTTLYRRLNPDVPQEELAETQA
ncbi:MAG: Regulatory protein AtoC [Verrucomicrobiae bacterium]|nr:Regulatory protein AtoC [Verrucomicrobiae bacterium]